MPNSEIALNVKRGLEIADDADADRYQAEEQIPLFTFGQQSLYPDLKVLTTRVSCPRAENDSTG